MPLELEPEAADAPLVRAEVVMALEEPVGLAREEAAEMMAAEPVWVASEDRPESVCRRLVTELKADSCEGLRVLVSCET